MANFSNNPVQSGTTNTTSQFMATNSKDYSKFGYWLNGIDVTSRNLKDFNPFIRGYARIFMYRAPMFMLKGFENLTKRFKAYLEVGFKSVSGIGDIEVEFEDYEGGYNNRKFSNVSSATDNTDTITIVMYELSGSPIREFLTTWITGTRDLFSGVAHYHGLLKDPVKKTGELEYGEENHTAEFIYYTTDPTAHRVEYACLFAHCFPTKVDKDHLNYESGDHSNVTMDFEFRCTKYESRYINDIATFYVAMDTIDYNSFNFNPGITEDMVKSSNTTFA